MGIDLEPSRSLLTIGPRAVGEVSGVSFATPLASFEPGPAAFVCVWTALPSASVSVSVHRSKPVGPPSAEADEWVEFSVASQAGLLLEDAEGEDSVELTAIGGATRVRVESRHRRQAAQMPRDTDKSIEALEIWVWSSAIQPVTASPAAERPVTAHHEVHAPESLPPIGKEAGDRVGLAVWGPVEDQDGHCRSQIELIGKRRYLFRRYACVGNWMGADGWSDLVTGEVFEHYFDSTSDASTRSTLATRGCYVTIEFLAINSPTSVDIAWNWRRGRDSSRVLEIGSGEQVLPAPSRLTLSFAALPPEGGSAGGERTQLTVEQHGLPSGWAADMQLFWSWRLAWLADFVALHR